MVARIVGLAHISSVTFLGPHEYCDHVELRRSAQQSSNQVAWRYDYVRAPSADTPAPDLSVGRDVPSLVVVVQPKKTRPAKQMLDYLGLSDWTKMFIISDDLAALLMGDGKLETGYIVIASSMCVSMGVAPPRRPCSLSAMQRRGPSAMQVVRRLRQSPWLMPPPW